MDKLLPDLASTIGAIYEAATDASRYAELPGVVAAHFGTDSCIFHFCHKPSGHDIDIPPNVRLPVGTANFDATACTAYASYYHERNEWYARGWKKGFPVVVLGQELMNTRDLARTEWSDYCRLTGMFHLVGAQFLLDERLITALGVHRRPNGQAFVEADRHKMALLLPHLQRALQLRERLEMAETGAGLAFELLDGLSVGVVIVDAQRRIVFANRIGARALSSADALVVRRGVLETHDPRDVPNFARIIAKAAQTGAGAGVDSGGFIKVARAVPPPLPVLVAPLNSRALGFGAARPACAVVFSVPDATLSIGAHALARRWDLTPAQARLLAALTAGMGLASYAASAGIGIGTVRAHLKELFAKVGCHRQSDLIRIVLTDPVVRLGE